MKHHDIWTGVFVAVGALLGLVLGRELGMWVAPMLTQY